MSTNGIALTSIGDFADHLLPHFVKKGKFESMRKYQSYKWLDEAFKPNRYRVAGGNSLEWRVSRTTNGSFAHIRPFQVTPVNYVDVFSKGSIRWAHSEIKAVWNEIIAKSFTGESALVDYMMGEYEVAIKALCDGLEESGFKVPTDSSDDRTPHGVPYWFPKLGVGVEDPDGGFNGQTAVYSGGGTTTTIGGTERSTVDYSKTWVATYNSINAAFLDTLRRAQEYTLFEVPQDLKQYVDSTRSKFRLYFPMNRKLDYERLVNAGPDDRNGDANPFKGTLTFRGQPVYGNRYLDDVADEPIYSINFDKFLPFVHSGFWMKWDDAIKQDDRHTYAKAMDCRYNYALTNEREGGFCIHRPRTA